MGQPRCIDWYKEKTPPANPPKPAAAKLRSKRGKEPVPAAESAAESSGPNRATGRRLRARSAEPSADDEAPMSKPSEDEVTTAEPKQRLKRNIKAAVEKSLRRGK